jgi:sugar lactone lactonase YvrE
MSRPRFAPVTRRTRRAFAGTTLALSALAAACGGGAADDADDAADSAGTAAAPGSGTTLAAVSSGLSTPESVLWSAAHSAWYVSNINGNPSAKDDNGFIVRLSADGGVMDSVPFINGADDDITLHAPKGMAIVGDTLWVTDIDAMRGFNVSTGMLVASVDLAPMKATFLNDATAGADGTIYITDTGIAFDAAGNVTNPGKSRVFAIKGRTASEAVVFPDGSGVNGIAWDASRDAFLVLSFASKSIYSWKPGSAPVVVAEGAGGADGLVILADGRAVYSSWTDSSLHALSGTRSSALRTGFPDPADIGYDPARNIIAIPLFSASRLEFLNVPAATADTAR